MMEDDGQIIGLIIDRLFTPRDSLYERKFLGFFFLCKVVAVDANFDSLPHGGIFSVDLDIRYHVDARKGKCACS